MKIRFKRLFRWRRRDQLEQIEQAAENAPRITNQTVAEHREQVLSSARKYILPLQHSKRQIVVISTILLVLAIIGFFVYSVVSLYRLQSTTTFMYRVTQVIPFPIARAGSDFVAYENYLFELRRYIHYYEVQQEVDFDDPRNVEQLNEFKKRALDKVINDAFVKKLAAQHGVSVSGSDIDALIATWQSQGRLGNSEDILEKVLEDRWGWTVADFRRSLAQELLTQRVLAKLDTEARQKAEAAHAELIAGADFAEVARKYSEDTATKEAGGDIGYSVDRATERNLTAEVTDALFRLQPGQYSAPIDTSGRIVIVKNLEADGNKIRAAQIVFFLDELTTYVDDMKEQQKTQAYISL